MTIFLGYIFYYLSALIGISIGYHRYFTHRSFNANPISEIVMLFFGLICGGRSALTWSAVHRMHHAKSDTEDDPHSPIFKGMWNVLLSQWRVEHIPKKFIIDLLKNKRVVFFHRYGKIIHLLYALLLILISFNLFIIGAVIPFVLSWISFGMLNFFAHKNGTPTDLILLNFIAPGEGWHKTHHDFPWASRLHRYDIAGWLIEKIFIRSKSSC
jgi:fatty-acid desaturase